jgi:serine/threonine protein kinase
LTPGGEIRLTPQLKYSAPEVVDSPSSCTFSSDMFSLGCLIYALFKINADKNCKSPHLITAHSLSAHKDFMKQIDRQDFSCIPQALRPIVQRMLNPDSNLRVSINDFANHGYFKDPFIQTTKQLESLIQKELQQQQTFLKGLNKIILKFEP